MTCFRAVLSNSFGGGSRPGWSARSGWGLPARRFHVPARAGPPARRRFAATNAHGASRIYLPRTWPKSRSATHWRRLACRFFTAAGSAASRAPSRIHTLADFSCCPLSSVNTFVACVILSRTIAKTISLGVSAPGSAQFTWISLVRCAAAQGMVSVRLQGAPTYSFGAPSTGSFARSSPNHTP